MGLIEEAWDAAVDTRERTKMDQQLEQMKEQGYDVCKLCGEQVPVHADDEHEDVLRRLTEHANEADDHVHHSENGWMLVDDIERAQRSAIGQMAADVRNKSFAVLLGMSIVAWAVEWTMGWTTVDNLVTAAYAVAALIFVIVAVAGLVVAWFYGGKG